MLVKEIMNSDAAAIASDASLFEACKEFERRHTDRLFVVLGEGPVGVLTKQRLLEVEDSEPAGLHRTEVGQAMEAGIVACYEDTAVEDAAALVQEEHLSEIPVVNRYSRLVGRVSVRDIPVDTTLD